MNGNSKRFFFERERSIRLPARDGTGRDGGGAYAQEGRRCRREARRGGRRRGVTSARTLPSARADGKRAPRTLERARGGHRAAAPDEAGARAASASASGSAPAYSVTALSLPCR